MILLGDYIDRGPNSKGVLNRVMELEQLGAIILRGNHDQMMVDAVSGEPEAIDRWEKGGAISTLQSYDKSIINMKFPNSDIFLKHVNFLRNLDYYYETEDYIFVHAGLQPGQPIQETNPYIFVWIREEFYQNYNGRKTVVFGHTPTVLLQGSEYFGVYFADNNIIGIDGAAAYGGRLNCLELPSKNTFSTRNNT